MTLLTTTPTDYVSYTGFAGDYDEEARKIAADILDASPFAGKYTFDVDEDRKSIYGGLYGHTFRVEGEEEELSLFLDDQLDFGFHRASPEWGAVVTEILNALAVKSDEWWGEPEPGESNFFIDYDY